MCNAKKGTVNLYETKLLLVGHGYVGKTSLMKRLIYDDFIKNEKTTEGIDIKQWTLSQGNKEELKIKYGVLVAGYLPFYTSVFSK